MSLVPRSERNDEVAVVVVLYNPDAESLAHVRELAGVWRHVFAVSNGITDAQRVELAAIDGLSLIENPGNVGLARALNQGIELSLASTASFILLLDQDSRLPSGTIGLLVQGAKRLRDANVPVGCVAPRLVDRKAPEASVGTPGEPLTVATSGSLLTREAVLAVGQMWDELFIDGIDHEWCFRARAKGFAVVLDREATLTHDMGEGGVRIGNRFRPIHRSPFRHYHIVRNTLWLQSRSYIPLRWRLRELVKLAYRAPIYLLVSDDRKETLLALFRAVRDGTFNRSRARVLAT
jgi:rhamnosyltransferase